MKSLINFINESLRISQDDVNNMQMYGTLEKDIPTIISQFNIADDPIIDNSRDNCYRLNPFIACLNGVDNMKLNDASWENSISVRFKGQKSLILIYFENNCALISFIGLLKRDLKQLNDILLEEFYYEQFTNHDLLQNVGFYGSDTLKDGYVSENIEYEALVEFLEKFFEKYISLFVKKINTELKPGEVIPGYKFEDIENRYKGVFSNIETLRTGNIRLSGLNGGNADGDTFTIYCNVDFNEGVLIRRWGADSDRASKLMQEVNPDDLFNRFDEYLRKRGYNI